MVEILLIIFFFTFGFVLATGLCSEMYEQGKGGDD